MTNTKNKATATQATAKTQAQTTAEKTTAQAKSEPKAEKTQAQTKQKKSDSKAQASNSNKTQKMTLTSYSNVAVPTLSADGKAIVYATSAQDKKTDYVLTRWNGKAEIKRLNGYCAEIALARAEAKKASLLNKKNSNDADPDEWTEGTKNYAELKGVNAVIDRIKLEQSLKGFRANGFEKDKPNPQKLFACYLMHEQLPINASEVLTAIKAYTEQARASVDKLQNGETVAWTEEQRAKATTIRQAIRSMFEPFYPDDFKLSIKFEHSSDESEEQKNSVTILDIIFGTSLPDGRKLYDLTERQKNGQKYKAFTKEFNRLMLRIAIEKFVRKATKDDE